MFKRSLSLLSLSMLLLNGCSDSKDKYILTGNITDSTLEGKSVYLFTGINPHRVDSTKIVEGQFKFENYAYFTDYAFIQLDERHYADFFIEPESIRINLRTHVAETGTLNQLFVKYKQEELELSKEYQSFIANYLQHKRAEGIDEISIEEAIDSIYETSYTPRYKNLNLRYLEGNENNIMGVEAIYTLSSIMSLEELKPIILRVGEDIRGHNLIQKIENDIINSGPAGVGKPFIDFSIEKVDGSKAAFSDYVGKGKYVLVHFWASWSTPCKEVIPFLENAYSKYKNENFNVVGVAVEDKLEDTKTILKKLKPAWTQLLNGLETPTGLYEISSIPYLILFSPDGRIIERGIYKENIEEVLKHHLTPPILETSFVLF